MDDTPLDKGAELGVDPVDYEGQTVVTARFSKPAAGRTVTLESATDGGWSEIATGEQDESGSVTFRVADASTLTLRAVAQKTTVAGVAEPAVATPEVSAKKRWKRILTTDFSDAELDQNWSHRATGIYAAYGRNCSAPYPGNVALADGFAELSVTKETNKSNRARARAAGCKEDESFRNAMISTEQKFTLNSGVVAARVKLATGQGMHGAVWLQSYNESEIDFMESYGYGRGLTSVIHVEGKRYPAANKDTYVLTDEVTDRDWWSQYHVFSVEWDRQKVIFRIDGQETRRIEQKTPDTSYFIVASMLSSDWEQKRFQDPVRNAPDVQPTTLPQTMSVDWVQAWALNT